MKALVLIAHGSRREASNQEVKQLAERISNSLTGEYHMVETAFLELAKPLIPDSIDLCARNNCTEIDVIPYFLAAGRHVYEDIPEELNKARAVYPHLTINVYPHIGAS